MQPQQSNYNYFEDMGAACGKRTIKRANTNEQSYEGNIKKKRVLQIDDLPDEIIHGIIDFIPNEEVLNLRFLNSKWEEVVSNSKHVKFYPLLSVDTLTDFSNFMEYSVGKNIPYLRVGRLSEYNSRLILDNLNIPNGIKITTIIFEEHYNLEDAVGVSHIIQQCPNVEKIVFKNYQPLHNSLDINQLITEEFAKLYLKKLKCLEFVRNCWITPPVLQNHQSIDCTFTSYIPTLTSFQIFQMSRTHILNISALPLSIRILELCSRNVEGPLVEDIFIRLVNLKVFTIQYMVGNYYVPSEEINGSSFIISLNFIETILSRTNIKSFNCVPARLETSLENFRVATNNLKINGKIAKWWIKNSYFRLRVIKPK